MDVRCESCGTEYELDDGKLKSGGVTVKCANCGHMFKVKLRAEPPGRPRVASPARGAPAPYPLADRTPPPQSPPWATSPPAGAPQAPLAGVDSGRTGEPRSWMVKLEDGQVRTCTELATLQQWIVTGQVSRTADISRNGKTWKPLSGIAELSPFFDLAEEAGRHRSGPQPAPRAPRSSAPFPPAASAAMRAVAATPPNLPARAPGPRNPAR